MKKALIPILLSLCSSLLSSDTLIIGCDIESTKEKGCSEDNILKKDISTPVFKLNNLITTQKPDKKPINITEGISSIRVQHKKKNFTIERYTNNKQLSCPPSCIQPLNIEKVKTVGTLETLKLINSLNKNKRVLIIDSRNPSEYKKETIPTAINIPYTILEKNSIKSDIILKLLGAKKKDKGWSFNNVYQLLIFDKGIWNTEARKIIYRLIELKYPQNKILYYHGGFKNWKEAGLTTSH